MTDIDDQHTGTLAAARAPSDSITPIRNPFHRPDLAAHILLTTTQAAALTTYTPHSLENLRSAGRGPAFIKIRGGAVAYRLRDLLAWQESHRVATLDQD